jgi:uncharacterized membrane protein
MSKHPSYLLRALFVIAVVLFLAFSITAIALAEGTTPETPYTWEYIGTIAGAAAVTLILVQFLKLPLDRVWKIPTRFVVFIIASSLLIFARAILHGLTWPEMPLLLINAVIATTSALGMYEVTFAKMKKPEQ